MGIEDIRDALVVRERSFFLLTDPDGNVPPGNARGYGIYHADTRHLSSYQLTLNGVRPVMLLSTAEHGYAMEQVMTNPTLQSGAGRTIKRGTVEIRRTRVIADLVEETLRLVNFNPFPVTLSLLYELGADFADIFDVRGYERERHGEHRPAVIEERAVSYSYCGIDGRERATRVEFDRKPDYLDDATALFRLTLPPRQATTMRVEISLDGQGAKRRPARGRLVTVGDDYRRWNEGCTSITTDNEFFNRVLGRSLNDIRMLWSETAEGESYPAAGTPWFDAPFGRDSCIMAMQMLAYRPSIARNVLRLMTKWQGRDIDHARDEEPGKVFHELRFDELSRSGELPYSPYYGSIDSTPLFLMLAAAYFEWTGDARLMRTLVPAITAGIDWLERYGDVQGRGYLSYEKRSAKGLINQGWKDSWDAIVHADGSLAQAPIALAEVQGYAYAARTRLAPALDRIGETKLADKLRRDARRLHRRFNGDFWMDGESYVAVALDGEGRRVESVTSNPVHCLWSGILDAMRAPDVVRRAMADDMFAGWGIRTLSEHSPRFNPLGYHVGTVWPHDNSIAAMGFKMYGFENEAMGIATAMFDAATSFPYFRLPELFGGERRSPNSPPVPYPVACRPQSWAAGTFPLITQALLGLKAEAPDRRLRIINPTLPHWLNTVRVEGLRVGGGNVTLVFRRQGYDTRVEVQEATGGLDVIVSKRWPL